MVTFGQLCEYHESPWMVYFKDWMVWCVNYLSENRLHGWWDLFCFFFGHTSRNVGSSSLSRDRTRVPWGGNEQSEPLHCQGGPLYFLNCILSKFGGQMMNRYFALATWRHTTLAGEWKYPLPSARDNIRMRWVYKSRRTSIQPEEPHCPLALPWNSFSQKSSEVTGETSHQNLPFLLSPAVCPSNQPHTGSVNSRVKGRDTLPYRQQESSKERLEFQPYEIKLLSSSLSDEPRVLGKSLCWVWDGLDWFDFTLLTKLLVVWMVKNLPTMQETRVWSLGQPLEQEMVTHSSILAWRI